MYTTYTTYINVYDHIFGGSPPRIPYTYVCRTRCMDILCELHTHKYIRSYKHVWPTLLRTARHTHTHTHKQTVLSPGFLD